MIAATLCLLTHRDHRVGIGATAHLRCERCGRRTKWGLL